MALQIGGKTVSRNSRVNGFLEVARNADNSPLGLPYIIINGKEEGPTVAIDSSVDGDEPDGIDAILRLAKMVKPEELKGTLLLVPVVNPPAFMAGTRLSPLDGLRMGSCYPGNPKGRMSERLAYAHWHEFVIKADYVITCHCGGGGNVLRNFIIVPAADTGKVGSRSLQWAKASGVPIVEQNAKSHYLGNLIVEAPKRGIPVVMPEIDTEVRSKDVAKVYECIVNLLLNLGMIAGEAKLPKRQYVSRCEYSVNPNRMGMWVPMKNVGARVKKGETIGIFLNPYTGEEVERVRSEFSGIISQRASRGVITQSVINIYGGGEILEEVKNR